MCGQNSGNLKNSYVVNTGIFKVNRLVLQPSLFLSQIPSSIFVCISYVSHQLTWDTTNIKGKHDVIQRSLQNHNVHYSIGF